MLAVVIPALDEAPTIGAVVTRALAQHCTGFVIVIDDGSADATAALAETAGARVLRNGSPQGKGASLSRGMTAAVAAGAALIATLDGDGQHRPEDLPRLHAASLAFPDRIVIGSRRASAGNAPRARRIANRIADFWVSWAAGHPVDDSQSGFRIYPAALIRGLATEPPAARGFAFESEILIDAARRGFRTVAVDIPTIYDARQRPSHFRPVSDIARIVGMVAGKLLRRGMDPRGLWRSLSMERGAPTRNAETGTHNPSCSARAEDSRLCIRQRKSWMVGLRRP